MTPATGDRLVADLTAFDVESGATVLVHSSLSALGDVPGGEQTVVLPLRRVLDPDGTIIVPSQSWQLCDPAYLKTAPEESWDEIRDSLPAYDPLWTPTRSAKPSELADAVPEIRHTIRKNRRAGQAL